MEGKRDNNATTDDPMYYWERLQETQRKKMKLLEEEADKIQKEKDTMNSAVAANISDDDIIEMDAGGTIVKAFRSTLTSVPDSMFSYMFSGRWEKSLRRDNGRVFIDEDPELIVFIVNFLRTKAKEDPSSDDVVVCPKIPEGKEQAFRVLLNYYGLTHFFYPPSIYLPLDINNIDIVQPHGTKVNVTKSDNKIQLSKRNNTSEHYYFLACKQPLNSSGEGSFWKVTIDAYPDDVGLLLGIIGTLDASNLSYSNPTCCGWTGGTSIFGNVFYINGEDGREAWHDEGFTEGECLYFHLKSNKLTMFSVQKNEKFTMDVATTDEYYIHFNIHGPSTKITLEPLNKDESTCLL